MGTSLSISYLPDVIGLKKPSQADSVTNHRIIGPTPIAKHSDHGQHILLGEWVVVFNQVANLSGYSTATLCNHPLQATIDSRSSTKPTGVAAPINPS